MNQQRIIMNFSMPPSLEDIEVMAAGILETLPEDLAEFCEGLAIEIEDMPDETIVDETGVDDAFDLLALYKSGGEIAPGIERKSANDDDVLVLFRRPVLDLWCESGEDLSAVIRQTMIEELGGQFDFSEDEIDEMLQEHYQSLLADHS